MRTHIEVKGLAETIAGFKSLGEKAQNRIVRNAARAGARSVAREVKQAAPRGDTPSQASARYGRLRQNIKVTQQGRLPYYTVHTNDAFWGAFTDKGTGQFNIAPGPDAKGPAARTHIMPRRWWTNTIERIGPVVVRDMIDNVRRSLVREFERLKR